MFNFQNLSPHEFESVAKDVMQKKLGISLRTYTSGRDSGVDIRGFIGNEIIIQVKHYCKSNFAQLKDNLMKEVEKVRRLKPNRYIIVTSLGLTPSNEDIIYGMFEDFMESKKDIVDEAILNSYLEDSNNIEILKVHNKLWLTSTTILDIIFNKELDIDSEVFMKEYQAKAKIVVLTKAYDDALNILENNNSIIIEGEPGIGKTMLSQLLIAYYCKEGYKFTYSSRKSIDAIKNRVKKDEKEIILIDNFLGQRVEDISGSYLEELRMLMGLVSLNVNKKIILNSRTIVLSDALNTNSKFADCLEYYDVHKYVMSVEKLTNLEKAKIFYNHIYFNELPNQFLQTIKDNEHYWEIVNHKGFNPRIIEYITHKNRISNIDSNEYYSKIINTLENPEVVWKEEFDQLSAFDRIYLFMLFTLITYDSFGGEYVSEKILKECFEYRLKHECSYDTTINYFKEITDKLAGGLIKINPANDVNYIGFINPSVEDYIYSYLKNLPCEIEKIAESSVYFEQIVKLSNLNRDAMQSNIVQRILNRNFLQMKKYTSIRTQYYWLKFIFEYNCKCSKLENDVHELFNTRKGFSNDRDNNANLIMHFFFEKDMYTFYNLSILLNNDLLVEKILEYLSFKQIVQFYRVYEKTMYQPYVQDKLYMIQWEIELDIIHELRTNQKNIMIQICDELNYSEDMCFDEHRMFLDQSKALFIEKYLIPCIEKRKQVLSFSPIIERLYVSYQRILDEIAFNIIDIDIIADRSEIYDTRNISDDYKEIVQLFSSETYL